MLRTLIEKECKSILLSPRFAGTFVVVSVLILLSVAVSTLLLGRLDNTYVLVTLIAFAAFGALGRAIAGWRASVDCRGPAELP